MICQYYNSKLVPFLLLPLLLVLAINPASGQNQKSPTRSLGAWFPLSKLNNYNGPEKRDIYVEGKFKASFGESFVLYGASMKFRISYKSPLYIQVNDRLKAGKSNVQVQGDILKSRRFGWYFKVSNITGLLEGDREFFKSRIAEHKNNLPRLYDLAYQARILADEKGEKELVEYRKEALEVAVQREIKNIPPKDLARHLEFARRLEEKYQMPKLAFRVYRKALKLSPQNQDLVRKLRDLGGQYHQGEWMLEEELKKLSGLEVSKKGEWMVKEKLLFFNFYQKFQKADTKSSAQVFYVHDRQLKVGTSLRETIDKLGRWPDGTWRKYFQKIPFEQLRYNYWNEKDKKLVSYFLHFKDRKLREVKKVVEKPLEK